MKDSKLISLLSTFSEDELRKFRLFLNSPYFNRSPDLITLFTFLRSLFPDWHSQKGSKENAFAHVYPNRRYDDLKIRHLMSNLLRLAESFLTLQGFEQQTELKKHLLLAQFRERNQHKHFMQTLRKGSVRQAIQVNLNQDYFQFRILQEQSEHLEQTQGRTGPEILEAGSEALDRFYLLNKLRQSCLMVNHRNLFGSNIRIELLQEVLDWFQQNPPQNLLQKAYHAALLFLQDEGREQHFQELQEVLHSTAFKFPVKEGKELHVLARNYCIRKMNEGHAAYIRELFNLYRLALDGGFLLDESGVFPPSSFKNIVSTGLKLKEYDWIASFIPRYSAQLESEIRVNLLNFSLARLEFEKGDYSEVIRLANNILFTDLFVILDTKTLLLKTYFELGEQEVLESFLSSFRQFIKRNKILAYHRDNYLNIIRLTKALVELNPYDKKARIALQERIQNTKVLTEKPWLLAKLKVV